MVGELLVVERQPHLRQQPLGLAQIRFELDGGKQLVASLGELAPRDRELSEPDPGLGQRRVELEGADVVVPCLVGAVHAHEPLGVEHVGRCVAIVEGDGPTEGRRRFLGIQVQERVAHEIGPTEALGLEGLRLAVAVRGLP